MANGDFGRDEPQRTTCVSACVGWSSGSSCGVIGLAEVAQVNPRFILARLILLGKSQSFAVDLTRAVLANEPFFLVRRLDESAHIGPFMRNAAKAPKRREPGW